MCSKALPPPIEPSPPSVPHHNPTATTPDSLDLSQSVLSQPEKQALSELLTDYADILPQSTTSLGRTNLVQHKINVGSSPPDSPTALPSPPCPAPRDRKPCFRHAPSTPYSTLQ